jgi:multidrug resistance efflux pump
VEENPAKAAAELFVKVNPDVELVSADDQAGNATGNYVKVVQRVPVKLVFNEKPDAGLPLGPGESVVPTVKVQDFHYSLLTLAVVLAIVTGLALLILFAPARKPGKAR